MRDSGGMVILDESSIDEPEKKTELLAGTLWASLPLNVNTNMYECNGIEHVRLIGFRYCYETSGLKCSGCSDSVGEIDTIGTYTSRRRANEAYNKLSVKGGIGESSTGEGGDKFGSQTEGMRVQYHSDATGFMKRIE